MSGSMYTPDSVEENDAKPDYNRPVPKYVMVEGKLQLDSWANRQWAKRSAKQVPQGVPEEAKEPEVPRDTRSEFEVLQDLDETPEL